MRLLYFSRQGGIGQGILSCASPGRARGHQRSHPRQNTPRRVGRVARLTVDSVKQRNDALEEMVNQVRVKLLGAEIMTGLKKLQLPGLDLGGAKRMANSAMAAVKQGRLGYVLICATKPD